MVKDDATKSLGGVHIEVNGVFIAVGMQPVSELFEGFVDMESGYIIADESGVTSVDGFFVA